MVLGTAAVKDPDLVREACRAYPDRVAVAIDARAGRVAVAGWVEATSLTVEDLARPFADAGVAAFVHTDIDRDGALEGPNVAASLALARAGPVPVILSGGVSSTADLERGAGRGPGRPRRRDQRPGPSTTADRAGGGGAAAGGPMLKVRVIPCLDVDKGRVVKGINFVDLRDAGDPVARPRSTTGPVPTSSASSTSPPATRGGIPSSTWWRRRRNAASCP